VDKLYRTFSQGEEGEVFALANVFTGVEFVPYLADQDGPGSYLFSAILLDTPILGIGIASVFNGTLSFFMSHGLSR